MRRGIDKGNCSLCLGNEDAKHTLLNCPETAREEYDTFCKKWPNNKELLYTYRKIVNCISEEHVYGN
jgi:hypothetical protein